MSKKKKITFFKKNLKSKRQLTQLSTQNLAQVLLLETTAVLQEAAVVFMHIYFLHTSTYPQNVVKDEQ